MLVTLSVPVLVKVLAMPRTELVPSVSVLALLIVTLYKLAVPDNVPDAAMVVVPAVSVKEPVSATVKLDDNEILLAVDIVPVMFKALKAIVPLPEIVFEVPLMVTVLLLAVKVPFTVKFPEIVSALLRVTDPLTLRLHNFNPLPDIVFAAPVIVSVPPALCVNTPDPEVARLPATLIAVDPEPVIPDAEKVSA